MIRFFCPQCQAVYDVPDKAAGKKTSCRKCGQRLQVPRPVLPTERNKTVLGKLIPPFQAPGPIQVSPHRPALPPPLPPPLPPAQHSSERMHDALPDLAAPRKEVEQAAYVPVRFRAGTAVAAIALAFALCGTLEVLV
jgi:hypothetical protein